MDSGYLLKILQDLGSENCDRNMFLDVLQQIKPQLNQDKVEEQVARSLLMMVTQPSSPEWNVVAFGASVLETVIIIFLKLINVFMLSFQKLTLIKQYFSWINPHASYLVLTKLKS